MTTKPAARKTIYQQYQRLLNQSGPYFPLIQPTQVFVSTKDLKGAVYNAVYDDEHHPDHAGVSREISRSRRGRRGRS